ncbi:hypothetical protein SEA_KEELAN_14 [Gordonia phage Keelan]|nr:hypothetical protein SEA_KEELAN_14 [Gordonia phage Keelan]
MILASHTIPILHGNTPQNDFVYGQGLEEAMNNVERIAEEGGYLTLRWIVKREDFAGAWVMFKDNRVGTMVVIEGEDKTDIGNRAAKYAKELTALESEGELGGEPL